MQDSEKEADKCSRCEYASYGQKPEDMPTDVAGLGFRVWFTLLSAIVLGLAVNQPSRDSIISILIFVIPMMREYYGFRPKKRRRAALRMIQLGILWIIVALCALYIVEVFTLVERKIIVTDNFPVLSGCGFDFIVVWILLLVMALLTIADYFAYRPRR